MLVHGGAEDRRRRCRHGVDDRAVLRRPRRRRRRDHGDEVLSSCSQARSAAAQWGQHVRVAGRARIHRRSYHRRARSRGDEVFSSCPRARGGLALWGQRDQVAGWARAHRWSLHERARGELRRSRHAQPGRRPARAAAAGDRCWPRCRRGGRRAGQRALSGRTQASREHHSAASGARPQAVRQGVAGGPARHWSQLATQQEGQPLQARPHSGRRGRGRARYSAWLVMPGGAGRYHWPRWASVQSERPRGVPQGSPSLGVSVAPQRAPDGRARPLRLPPELARRRLLRCPRALSWLPLLVRRRRSRQGATRPQTATRTPVRRTESNTLGQGGPHGVLLQRRGCASR